MTKEKFTKKWLRAAGIFWRIKNPALSWVLFFESDYLGKPIYKVGCDNEDLFFRVSCSVNGINEPRRLFYDNPEQYERHFKTTISPETRKIWTEKYNIAVLIDENRRNKQNAPEYVTIS